MFGLVTGENLGQRRPYSGVSLIVLVKNNTVLRYSKFYFISKNDPKPLSTLIVCTCTLYSIHFTLYNGHHV